MKNGSLWKHITCCLLVLFVGVSNAGCGDSETKPKVTVGEGNNGDQNNSAQNNSDQNNGDQNNSAQNNSAQNNSAQNNSAQNNSAQNNAGSGNNEQNNSDKPCTASAECGDGFYCKTETCGESGVCEPNTGDCPAEDAPVCGCDGETYGNACEAAVAGSSVDHEGECEEPAPTACTSGEECPNGSTCRFPVGACGEEEGTCEPLDGCSDPSYEPVCGCDGETYDACVAGDSGVRVAHEGACEVEPVSCTSDAQCEGDLFCLFPAEACGGEGVCEERPEGCDFSLDPVCGCDGQTYGNQCLRLLSGVSLRHVGECETGGECSTSDECADGEFCECSGTSCGAGTCVAPPESCDRVLEPVCGCDGVTYGNDCQRQRAGTCFFREGACETIEPGECRDNRDCGFDQYCACADDTCGGGSCADRPTECLDVYEPVCGCDGQTYSNDCQRARAGVCAQYSGECEETDGCTNNDACGDGEYCAFVDGTCYLGNRVGSCEARPVACPDEVELVCGCNGQTYSSACEAASAGVSISHSGRCDEIPRICGGLLGGACESGEYCDPIPGSCDSPSSAGICAEISPTCPLISAPVCGCNGETYDNDCLRVRAQVGKRHDGACLTAGEGCTSNDQCPLQTFCEADEDTCDAPTAGQCQPRPGICNDVLDPVCGCDLNVYQNDCQRQRAGVRLLHRGTCRL